MFLFPRHRMKAFGLIVFALSSVMVTYVDTAAAQSSVGVGVGVGDTTLHISGWTSPQAFVTIKRDGGVISSMLAGGDGIFDITLPAQDPGISDLIFSAIDAAGNPTDSIALQANVREHFQTDVSVYLPPTLSQDTPNVRPGMPIHVKGRTKPSATVIITVAGEPQTVVKVATDGSWEASIATIRFTGGTYEYFVQAIDRDGNQSYPTSRRTFVIESQPSSVSQQKRAVSGGSVRSAIPPTVQQKISQSTHSPKATLQESDISADAGSKATVNIHVSQGTPPFSVTVHWGDQSVRSIQDSGSNIRLTHVYQKPGVYKGSVTLANGEGEVNLEFTVNVKAVKPESSQWWWLLIIGLCLFVLFRVRYRIKLHGRNR